MPTHWLGAGPAVACCQVPPVCPAQPLGLVGAFCLLAGTVLLPTAPAEAQTTVDLVSNLNETNSGIGYLVDGSQDSALAFETGGNASGYIVKEVVINMRLASGGNPARTDLSTAVKITK